MESFGDITHMIMGNIALVQVQATVAAFIVSVFAMTVGSIINQRFEFDHALLVTASSMFTATSSCFVLGKFSLIVTCRARNRKTFNNAIM